MNDDTAPFGAAPAAPAAADPATGLGADDRAGVGVVLTTALEVLKRGLPHPPLTFLFAIQEEVGLYGARYVSATDLGKPKLAFNFDGGAVEKITVGATGGYRMDVAIEGLPSHAGVAPDERSLQTALSRLDPATQLYCSNSPYSWHFSYSRKPLGTYSFVITKLPAVFRRAEIGFDIVFF